MKVLFFLAFMFYHSFIKKQKSDSMKASLLKSHSLIKHSINKECELFVKECKRKNEK